MEEGARGGRRGLSWALPSLSPPSLTKALWGLRNEDDEAQRVGVDWPGTTGPRRVQAVVFL